MSRLAWVCYLGLCPTPLPIVKGSLLVAVATLHARFWQPYLPTCHIHLRLVTFLEGAQDYKLSNTCSLTTVNKSDKRFSIYGTNDNDKMREATYWARYDQVYINVYKHAWAFIPSSQHIVLIRFLLNISFELHIWPKTTKLYKPLYQLNKIHFFHWYQSAKA